MISNPKQFLLEVDHYEEVDGVLEPVVTEDWGKFCLQSYPRPGDILRVWTKERKLVELSVTSVAFYPKKLAASGTGGISYAASQEVSHEDIPLPTVTVKLVAEGEDLYNIELMDINDA